MKSFATLALLSATQAAKLRDIFDAYDIESRKEAQNKSDTIDPAALTAEIGGDDIAREVKLATAGVEEGAEQALLQMDDDVQAVQTDDSVKFIPEEGIYLQIGKNEANMIKYEVDEMHNLVDGDLEGRARFVQEKPKPKEASVAQEQNVGVTSENMASSFAEWGPDRAENEYDKSYIQTKLSNLVGEIDGPDALNDVVYLQSGWRLGANRIYDEDGDGVEDNTHKSFFELDEFYYPAVFGAAEDLHNTHHGNLPGHTQREFDVTETEPVDHYSLVRENWTRL